MHPLHGVHEINTYREIMSICFHITSETTEKNVSTSEACGQV
jgi:hypothetical protein